MGLHPLTDVQHYLQDDSPAVKFMKESLQAEDIVVFTDSQFRDTFKQVRDMMMVLEQKYHAVILANEEFKDLRADVEKILEKITNNAVPVHFFYKQKYYASGRFLGRLYAHGELETLLGLKTSLVH